MENHDVFLRSDEDEQRIETFVNSGASDDSDYMSEDVQVGKCSSIEDSMTPGRMENILENFLAFGQHKCLSKPRISYSQLRANKRHFAKSDAEKAVESSQEIHGGSNSLFLMPMRDDSESYTLAKPTLPCRVFKVSRDSRSVR